MKLGRLLGRRRQRGPRTWTAPRAGGLEWRENLPPGALKVHWCLGCGGGSNFGDILSPLLLRRRGVTVGWAPPDEADLLCVGSILHRVPAGWRGTVLGTGLMRDGARRDLAAARVLAVRGALTRDACGLPAETPLGDPGLLADELLPARPPKAAGAIVVPHYVDRRIHWRHLRLPVVPITTEPTRLLEAIASAELVYTSSLHGLIAADVLGVPHVLEVHRNVAGGLFKFQDYASAFGESITPGVPRLTDRAAMAARQRQLLEIVDAFAAEVRLAQSTAESREPTIEPAAT